MTKQSDPYRIKPNFYEFVPTLKRAEDFGSAREAFSSGDYEFAAHLAAETKDATTGALAQIMCGLIETGLVNLEKQPELDDEAKVIKAYAHWVADQNETALAELHEVKREPWGVVAKHLSNLITCRSLQILVYYNDNSKGVAPFHPGEEFNISSINTSSEDATAENKKFFDQKGFDLILCLHTVPSDLHERVSKFDGPIVTVISDIDMNIASHAPMLSRSDCLLVGTTYEHYYLEKFYGVRTASFPGMRLRERPELKPDLAKDIDYDICFTGRAFKSYWPDKARMLFRIACIDDPDLRIKIFDGFLSSEEYDRTLNASRFNALTNRYGFSLMHGRTLDALWEGCRIIGYGAVRPNTYAPSLQHACEFVSEDALEKEVTNLLSNEDPALGEWQSPLNEMFVEKPINDRRLLKFSLFQTLLEPRSQERLAPVDPDVVARKCHTTVNKLLKSPGEEGLHEAAVQLYQEALKERPRGTVLAFNYAQLLWILGRKEAAIEAFEDLKTWVAAGDINPMQDIMVSHLYPLFNSIMPYHVYYMACMNYLRDDEDDGTLIRNILLSATDHYLALASSQAGDLQVAKGLLERSLENCPENAASAQLMVKVLYALEAPSDELWQIIKRAVELYPPYLHELLPFGLLALEQMNKAEHALALAKQWAYFVVRVEVLDDSVAAIPEQTWSAVAKYIELLPTSLKVGLETKQRDGR